MTLLLTLLLVALVLLVLTVLVARRASKNIQTMEFSPIFNEEDSP